MDARFSSQTHSKPSFGRLSTYAWLKKTRQEAICVQIEEVRMRQVRSVLGPIFHVSFLAHHLNVFFCGHRMHASIESDKFYDRDHRISDIKNFSTVFFTNWNLVFQTIYFVLAVTHDILRLCSLSPSLRDRIDRWKGFLFTSIVFPCSIFVSTMFWGVYSIDRELVYPEICDKFIPDWLNHCIHTNIVVFLIIEVLITNQLLPTFKSAFTALTVLTIFYDIIFFITFFIYGRFIYGLFHVFSWPQRIMFLLLNYFVTILAMKIGIVIENFKYSLSRKRIKTAKI